MSKADDTRDVTFFLSLHQRFALVVLSPEWASFDQVRQIVRARLREDTVPQPHRLMPRLLLSPCRYPPELFFVYGSDGDVDLSMSIW